MDVDTTLAAWSWPEPVRVTEDGGGLINLTWWVEGATGPVAVMQRLNTGIFVPEVHEDIEAVTARLQAEGVPTPRLMRTRAGDLWHTDADGGVFRCLSLVGDRTIHRVDDPADAVEAGRLVARVHRSLRDLQWSFRSVRAGAHDTPAHMASLAEALRALPEHRLHADVAPLAHDLFNQWAAWTGEDSLPRRVVHGDLKISNVRFTGSSATALVDLDTFAYGSLDIELGDALRSWCNPGSEDVCEAAFDLDIFEAAMTGYAQGARGTVSAAEWRSVVPGAERIALELSARFAADALRESYFGWDPQFGGRGEHNLLRARGQASLARSIATHREHAEGQLARIVAAA